MGMRPGGALLATAESRPAAPSREIEIEDEDEYEDEYD